MNDAISSLEIPSLQDLKFSTQKNATSYNWKALFWEFEDAWLHHTLGDSA